MQLETAKNLELHSILGVLDQLEVDGEHQLKTRRGGKAFGPVIPVRRG